ncbi:MAG: type I glyceraldehyde-3-phosphate dehydrogenase [Candidatus Sumerlaeota bacterium]
MTTRVAINGLGRIGRAALKTILETPELQLVAANDLIPADGLAYLLNYDTVYGRYDKKVQVTDGGLDIGGKEYKLFSEKDPASLPWKELDVELVFECTGIFRKSEDLKKHLEAGAKKVILSAPAKSDDIPSVVHGVNQAPDDAQIISCASCTTNCITPVSEVLDRHLGIKKAVMTTIHAYTASQDIVDTYQKKTRRGRAAAANLVPTTTGAAQATTKVLTNLENRFDGVAVRCPVPTGSLSDLVYLVEKETTVDEVNEIFRKESETDKYKNVLGVTNDPIVSSDIVRDPRGSLVDLGMTQVVDGDLIKIMAWYDNEWGYTNQMIREAVRISA